MHASVAAPRTEQVLSSLSVSCARGAAGPKFLLQGPLPPVWLTSAPSQFPFREGGKKCRSGHRELAAGLLRVSRFPPFFCSCSIRVERRDVSSGAESASPAGGARVPSSPG